MKNKLFVHSWLILLLLLSSCTTERKCARKYPPQIITKDSIIIRKVLVPFAVHDTIFIPGETIYNTDTVIIENGLANSIKITASTDYANAWAQVIDSKLLLELIQNDTAIARLIKGTVETTQTDSYHGEIQIKKEFITHWYDPYARAIAGFYILLTILLIVLKFFKPF